MKLKTKPFICAIATLIIASSCCNSSVTGLRTDALEDAAWDSSVWISAADADVVTGKISGKNFLAADGSSWFWSSVTNDKDVVSAKWSLELMRREELRAQLSLLSFCWQRTQKQQRH